ncbi:anthrax toxin lethal factor-related metalloendopeptidase [Enterococcus faecalis]|uniref:anthrax toxin lethal factor-related metalloendopeptidase n=1 Tax=Enterococcus faecalis TaxID=1351 RepID=UPI0035EAC229
MIFKDFSIITQNGKEYIRINAELVDKEDINKKISIENEKVNREFNNRFGFIEEKRSIDFDFKGIGSSISIKEVNKELSMAIEAMEPKLANIVYDYMLNKLHGRIIFTDLPIWAISGMRMLSDDEDDISGLYRPFVGKMYIRMPFSLNKYNKDPEVFSARDPILHETGHAFDQFFGEKFSGKLDPISSSSTFKGVYVTEKEKLTEYAKTDEREFFAEAFRMYHVSPQVLNKVSPKTYAFIDTVIKMTIENDNKMNF